MIVLFLITALVVLMTLIRREIADGGAAKVGAWLRRRPKLKDFR